MPEAEALTIIGKFFEYGVVSAVLAYGWWQAERRAAAAQAVADERAERMAQLMVDQVSTNEKVMTTITVQNGILDRIVVFMDTHQG